MMKPEGKIEGKTRNKDIRDNSNVIREGIPGREQIIIIVGAKRVLKEEKENNENNAECIADNNNGMEALIGTNVEGMIENDVESSKGADQNLEINSRTGNVDKSKIGRNIKTL